MNHKKVVVGLTALFFIAFIGLHEIRSQSSNNEFHLNGDFFAGGGRAEDGFIIQGVIGGLAVGKSENGSFILTAGFGGTPIPPKHLNLPDTTIPAGGSQTVKLMVNESEEIAGGDITVTYEKNLVEVDDVTSDDFSLEYKDQQGQLVITIARDTGLTAATDAVLLEITFTAKNDAPVDAVSPLTFQNARLFEELTNRIPVLTTDGSLTITPPVTPRWGDADGDDDVDSDDASCVLQDVVGLKQLSAEAQIRADVSGDDTVSPLDAALILMYIVGKISEFPVENQAAPALASLTLTIPRFHFSEQMAKPGERVHIPIQFEGGAPIVFGVFTVKAPSGLITLRHASAETDKAGQTLIVHSTEEGLKLAFASAGPLPTAHTITWLEGDVPRYIPVGTEIPLTVTEVQLNEQAVTPEVIAHLEVVPARTRILPNYPNPFNPETWIPYHLAETADVTITIYNVEGQQVRQLHLGIQQPRTYVTRDRAAYWDGRNEVGERVASGVYFYQFQAGKFAATHKMVIRK